MRDEFISTISKIEKDRLVGVWSRESQKYYYGILNLLSKSSLAFASTLSFFILDYAEFKVGRKNLSTRLMGLSIAYAFIPCIIKITAAFLYGKYLNLSYYYLQLYQQLFDYMRKFYDKLYLIL